MKPYIVVFSFFILLSCNNEDLSNTRVYTEGKISSQTLDVTTISIKIYSENKVVAQTVPTHSGSFVLSGPLFSDGFTLNIDEKIKSFSTSSSGCEISTDSHSINIPKGISYIVFDEIILQK